MKKRLIIGLFAAAISLSAFSQDDSRLFNHLGAQVGVGTEGITLGLATPITPYLELSAGVNIMPGIKLKGDVDINAGVIQVPYTSGTGYDTYNLDKIKLEADFARTTFDAKLNVYPFGNKSSFFVAGGLSFGGKNVAKLSGYNAEVAKLYTEHPEYTGLIAAVIDQYQIGIDKQGYAKGEIRTKSVRPYAGLGFGRLVPKKRVSFRIEAGCQFIDKMKVYQNDQEVSITTGHDGKDDISKIVDKLTVYPVVTFSLTGRLF